MNDLRQKHDDAADTGDDTVLQEARQQAVRQHVMYQLAERDERRRQQFHHRLRPTEHRLEHDEQNQRKNDKAEHRMQHHGIDARDQRVRFRRHRYRLADDTVGLALGGLQFGDGQRHPGVVACVFAEMPREFVGALEQFGDAALAYRDRGDDGDAGIVGDLLTAAG